MIFGKPWACKMFKNSKVSYRVKYVSREHLAIGSGQHHFEAKACINHQQHEICYFPNVDHRSEVVIAFDESQAAFLAGNESNWSLHFREGVLGIAPDQRFDEGRLSYLY